MLYISGMLLAILLSSASSSSPAAVQVCRLKLMFTMQRLLRTCISLRRQFRWDDAHLSVAGRRRLEARAKRARTQIGKFFTCVSFLFLRRWASRCRRRSNVCSLVQEVVAWSHVGRCALCGLPVACVPGRLPPGKVRLAGPFQWEGLLGALHEWAWFFRARSRPSKVRSCLDSELWLCGRVLGEDWRVRTCDLASCLRCMCKGAYHGIMQGVGMQYRRVWCSVGLQCGSCVGGTWLGMYRFENPIRGLARRDNAEHFNNIYTKTKRCSYKRITAILLIRNSFACNGKVSSALVTSTSLYDFTVIYDPDHKIRKKIQNSCSCGFSLYL